MRCIILFLLAFNLHLSAAINAKVENGYLTYGNETYDSLQVNGYATLHGTIVTHVLQVNGTLSASQAKFGEIHVNGQATLSNCTIDRKSLVSGSISAISTIFQQELSLASDNSVFESCTLSTLRVLKMKNNAPQTVTLDGTTHVIGLITFESGNGKVIAGPECQITQGSIIGGKLQKSPS